MNQRPYLVGIMGPTAVGKTDLAVALVEALPELEIISVDSSLVYRHLNIGTAKPDAATQQRAPHRLIDIRDPHESYSAAQFRADALVAITEILAAGRTPLLVGGTFLYFRVLQEGLAPMPEADPAIRQALDHAAAEQGWPALHAELAQVDPIAASRIHAHDRQRIQRALEVWRMTGQPISVLQQQVQPLPWPLLRISCWPHDRQRLARRIAERFQRMLDQGFEQEVRDLVERYALGPEHHAMRAVGYRQMLKFLLGEYTYAEMVERGVIATRQLAKRQLTWLRSEPTDLALSDEDFAVSVYRARQFLEARLRLPA